MLSIFILLNSFLFFYDVNAHDSLMLLQEEARIVKFELDFIGFIKLTKVFLVSHRATLCMHIKLLNYQLVNNKCAGTITPRLIRNCFMRSKACRKCMACFMTRYRSSHRRCSSKKGVLKNFAKFAGKHLCQSLFLIKLQVLGLQLY